MLKVLVADSNVALCAAVMDAFDGRYSVSVCHDGKTALQQIRQLQPDIVWLDLLLPGMDGITILQTAKLAGICPAVIACTRFLGEGMETELLDCGVQYLMLEPCSTAAVLSRIESLACRLHRRRVETDPDTVIYEILLVLGVVGKRSGYQCLLEAVRHMVLEPDVQITKVLYPAVAAVCGGTPERIERALRSTISAAWGIRERHIWECYFPEFKDKCPSNGAFIGRVAECVRHRLQKAPYTSSPKDSGIGP